jgi:hypothetical protein
MSETSFAISQPFVQLWLKILVLKYWHDTVTKSYKPITRINRVGNGSFTLAKMVSETIGSTDTRQ